MHRHAEAGWMMCKGKAGPQSHLPAFALHICTAAWLAAACMLDVLLLFFFFSRCSVYRHLMLLSHPQTPLRTSRDTFGKPFLAQY